MSGMRKKTAVLGLVLLIAAVFVPAAGAFGQEPGAAQPQDEAGTGTIHPAPKDIKESVDIYVFLGWIWGMILLLVFVLRHKIKEMDRLHEIGYFSSKGKMNP